MGPGQRVGASAHSDAGHSGKETGGFAIKGVFIANPCENYLSSVMISAKGDGGALTVKIVEDFTWTGLTQPLRVPD